MNAIYNQNDFRTGLQSRIRQHKQSAAYQRSQAVLSLTYVTEPELDAEEAPLQRPSFDARQMPKRFLARFGF